MKDELDSQRFIEICKEYGINIVNKAERDERLVEVQIYQYTKTMPRWKALEFAEKLNEIGVVPIIDGVYMTRDELNFAIYR